MPGVSALLTTEDEGSSDDGVGSPERWSLWLPSAVSDEVYARGCTMGLREKEARLRRGQADDALHQICRQIRVRMGMIHYKEQVYGSGTGQGPTTRAQNLINQLTLKLNRLKARYRRAFRVLELLDPQGSWRSHLRQLNDDDVRPPTSNDRLVLGQGFMELSWIWRSSHDAWDIVNGGPDTSSDQVHESQSYFDVQPIHLIDLNLFRRHAGRMGYRARSDSPLGGRGRVVATRDGSSCVIFRVEGKLVEGQGRKSAECPSGHQVGFGLVCKAEGRDVSSICAVLSRVLATRALCVRAG